MKVKELKPKKERLELEEKEQFAIKRMKQLEEEMGKTALSLERIKTEYTEFIEKNIEDITDDDLNSDRIIGVRVW